jgi:hypothetical protein
MRGFVVVRSETGAPIGHGEYSELAVGDRVTVRFAMKFRDGSVDEETAVYAQRNVMQFVSDHHIQRGAMFKNAIDSTIEANGQYTLRTTGRDGKVKTETSHFDVPPDLSNGILANMMLNLRHDGPGLSVGMILPAGKGRMVRLHIAPAGTASFYAVAGDRRVASLFRVKIDLGGVAEVVAPMVGRQPADLTVWVLEGDVPVMVREVGQLSEGGPIVSIELAGTSFGRTGAGK